MKLRLKIMILAFTIMCMQNVFSQNKDVSGEITDTSGNLLPSVSVVIQGTSIGTATDFDGKYKISNVNANSVLVFSYLGMKSQSILVGNKSVINVVLQEDAEALTEIVIVGYGTQKKGLVTGATLNIKGEDIKELNTSSAVEGLQGITPGVNITRNNGQPGAGTKVVIRGLGTNGNSNPLFIVDGVAVGNIDYLNAADIQSIDVLKDAASAAIYGARASNGVILVTTVKGKKNSSPKISYNTYYGIQNVYKNLSPLNAQEYMYIIDEGLANDGKPLNNWEQLIKNNTWLDSNFPGNLGTQLGTEIWDNLQNGWKGTNWLDEIITKNSEVQNHTINITGGGENSRFAVGASHFSQEGLIGNHITDAGYKRLTARLNTEFILKKNENHSIITFGENLTYTNTVNKSVATGNIYYNDLHDALVQNPLMPASWQPGIDNNVNPFGFTPTLDGLADGQHNPIAKMFYRHNYNNLGNQSNQIIGNVYLEIQPIESLIFKSSFGFDSWFGHSRSFTPKYALGLKYSNNVDGVSQSQYQGLNTTFTNTLAFNKDFNKHRVKALIGMEAFKNDLNTNVGGSRSNTLFGLPQFAYLNISNNFAPTNVNEINVWGADWAAQGGALLSYFGRTEYNYDEKYLFSATLRADGSSNFAKGNRWGYFPSVSAGWVMSQEDFFKDKVSFLEYAKFRASWGQNGNQSVSNFLYSSTIGFSSPGYYFGDNKPISSSTALPLRVPNPDIRWETSEQINIGLDTRLFNSNLAVSVDWYKKTTKDWLVQAPVLGTFGASAPTVNGGDIENTGVEFFASWNSNVGDVNYGASLTGAFNKNKITRIANEGGFFEGPAHVISQGTDPVSRASVGLPIGYFYGYETNGILQNQSEVNAYVKPTDGTPYFEDQRPGDLRFVDQNQDGVIDSEDKVMLGDPNPDFELGIQLNAEYKGFYANVTMAGKFGMQVVKSYRSFADSPRQNYTTEVFSRWHGEGTSNTLPRLSSVANRNSSFVSDIYVHDADYLRINNLTIGVNLKDYITSLEYISSLKVYTSINNLHTFTKYEGMDPEVGYNAGRGWDTGIDLGLYPLPRTVMFGVNVDF